MDRQYTSALRLLADDLAARVEDGHEEHVIVGVTVYPAEGRFALGFETEGGRTLRLRMPWDRLEALGKALLDLAEERRLAGDV